MLEDTYIQKLENIEKALDGIYQKICSMEQNNLSINESKNEIMPKRIENDVKKNKYHSPIVDLGKITYDDICKKFDYKH